VKIKRSSATIASVTSPQVTNTARSALKINSPDRMRQPL
jgi:hypothetical protein